MLPVSFPIAKPQPWGFLDTLEVDPCGLLRLIGWSEEDSLAQLETPEILLDTTSVGVFQLFRTNRPDIQPQSIDIAQPGIVNEYKLNEDQYSRDFSTVSVMFPKDAPLTFRHSLRFVKPHYSQLLDSGEVFGREQIYGFGPPNSEISPEVLPLTKLLRGRILDFGCGSGALVRYLRSQGHNASGLELNREPIRTSLHSSFSSFISLYDGTFPARMPTKVLTAFTRRKCWNTFLNPSRSLQNLPALQRIVLC